MTKSEKKVKKVMREFKKGELPIGKSKKKVKSRKQAIAIALSKAGKSKPRAGLILGYAYVIRPEAILIALGLGLAFLSRDRRLPWQFGLAVAVSVLPFLVFLRVSRGAWALTSKSGFLTKSIEANPGWSFFELIGRNLVDFLPQLPELVGFPLVALAIWAVVRRPGRWLFFLMPLATLPLFSFRLEARYWAPYLPFFFFAAGIGLRELVVMMPEARRRVAAVALLVIMVGGVAWAAIDDWESVYSVNEAYEGMRDAGLWLRDEVDRDTRVAAYKPYVPFWADCTFVKYSKEPMTTKQLIETARMDGAEYLVVNVNVAQRLVPPLRPLLSNPPPHLAEMVTLIKIFSYEGRPVQNTAIYRINKPLHSEVTSPRR